MNKIKMDFLRLFPSRHPVFFTNFAHVLPQNANIMYFIDIVDENTVRIKKDAPIQLLPEMINDIKNHFDII